MLLDVMMPGQSGLEVLTIARAKGFDLPIIMVTALDSPDEVAAALERGADDYVTKPFSPKVLLARVKLRLRPARVALVPPPPPLTPSDELWISPSGVMEVEEPPPPPPLEEPGLVRSFLTKLKRAAAQRKTASPLPALTLELEMDVAVKVLCGDTHTVHGGGAPS